jgi:uncharacterized protein YbjT (DUF2867 family)
VTGLKVAVAGGTGLVGDRLTEALRRAGDHVVVIARSRGVDAVTGEGLDDTLEDVDVVVDVTNTHATDPEGARRFFGASTTNLLAAERHHGVGHHVVLSIAGVDRVQRNGHYIGKRHQEELVRAGPIPWTIVRATQFFEFAEMVVSWTKHDGTATIPPLLVQPIATRDVATALLDATHAGPQNQILEIAGPEPQDLVDMARRTLAARGDTATKLIPSWHDGPFDTEMAGDVLLPHPQATIAQTTFDDWLEGLSHDS